MTSANRKMINAAIFDLDGTLTRTPSPWRHVHERLGVWDGIACTYLEEWMSGAITYEEFCHRDTRLWRGRGLEEIESYLNEIEQNRHVPAIVQALVARGVSSVIISSGFRHIASKIQRNWNWAPLMIYANDLVDGPEVRIQVSGDLTSPISKKAHADAALGQIGALPANTLVVSDSVRDLEQLDYCGFHLHVREEDDLLGVLRYL